jgi:hypothetical protein
MVNKDSGLLATFCNDPFPKTYFILLLKLEIVMLFKSCFQHHLVFVLHPLQDR